MRLGEFKRRSAVQRDEGRTYDLECHGHDRARLAAVRFLSSLGVASDFEDLRVLENRGVELRGVFGLVVEPQTGRYFLHGVLLARSAYKAPIPRTIGRGSDRQRAVEFK